MYSKETSSLKLVLWLAIVSIVMLFTGLTSAYIVRQAEGNWLNFRLPFGFAVSTTLILLSSVTINESVSARKQNKQTKQLSYISVTLLLGVAFIIMQILSWKTLYEKDVVFAGNMSNPAGSFLYVITGLHLLHFISGFVFLVLVLRKLLLLQIVQGKGNTDLIFKMCVTYWHFLCGLWVYLFLFLLLTR